MKLYHLTPSKNLPSILQIGLIPQIGERSQEIGESTPAIYAFLNMISVEDSLLGWLGDCFEEETLSLIEITPPTNLQFEFIGGYEIIIKSSIPVECLKIVSDNFGG